MTCIRFIIISIIITFTTVGQAGDGWISLFDGETLNGWQASENKDSWKIEDGALITNGKRSHLFYDGNVLDHHFKNFEFSADVKTTPGSNSGIYIHTEYQDKGWPARGYECQVINSNRPKPKGAYRERKMTGSIYAIRNVWKAPANDNQWFNYRIVVQGRTIRTYIDGELTAEYTEPKNVKRPQGLRGRILSAGTFALQCHDPKSVVYYKNLKVKPLADDLPTPGKPLADSAFDETIIMLSAKNYPLVDLHVHLKGGLTLDRALANARTYGYTYGIAVNCGLNFPINNDASLRDYLEKYKRPKAAFFAMQAEGREWLDLFSKEAIAEFDYIFTDAMTWTNDNGKRMRLWIPDEVEIGDPENFMDQLVRHIEKIMTEPIDIYVNPTFLPDAISDQYDMLWTRERMDRVINALLKNDVALEINAKRKIPSPAFIKRAKAAGVKFTFGTNNGSADDLGRMQYCLDMIRECKLTPKDIWMPGK